MQSIKDWFLESSKVLFCSVSLGKVSLISPEQLHHPQRFSSTSKALRGEEECAEEASSGKKTGVSYIQRPLMKRYIVQTLRCTYNYSFGSLDPGSCFSSHISPIFLLWRVQRKETTRVKDVERHVSVRKSIQGFYLTEYKSSSSTAT